jgi:hypothetical protein
MPLGRRPDALWLNPLRSDTPHRPAVIFSGDSRFLAWRMEDGIITIVDLPALEKHVEAFEVRLLAK